MITTAITVVVIISLYLYSTRTFKYWEKRGIKYEKPVPLFGTNRRSYFLKTSTTQLAEEMYWKYPEEKVVGLFRSSRPELLIRDPELTKRILITDFSSFYERGLTPHNTVYEPLMQNLLFADGDLWKLLRQRMTPAFSTGKLKAMFPLIVERAERLQACAREAAASGKTIDARDLMARYTTDFIGACGFGLEADSLNDENSAFRKLGRKIFMMPIREAVVVMLKDLFPNVSKYLKLFIRLEGDFKELVGDILKKRNYKPCGRHDFIDFMLECKEKGTIVGDSITKFKPDGAPEEARLDITDDLIAAQVFIFFAAGFETSSSATSFTLHQLAFNQNVQRKAQEQVDRILSKHDGKLCYDAIKEMTYLEWVFREGMRIFPPAGVLIRQSTKPYTFPELNLTIDRNVRIVIPIQAIQNDSKYFDKPQEFRPERFDSNEFDSNNKYVYLPFGTGPRACIGERLGLMQSLAGLVAILSNFTVHPAPESKLHPTVDPRSSIVQSTQDGLPLLFCVRRPNTSL